MYWFTRDEIRINNIILFCLFCRVMLSAESRKEMIEWSDRLNECLFMLRQWHADQYRQLEARARVFTQPWFKSVTGTANFRKRTSTFLCYFLACCWLFTSFNSQTNFVNILNMWLIIYTADSSTLVAYEVFLSSFCAPHFWKLLYYVPSYLWCTMWYVSVCLLCMNFAASARTSCYRLLSIVKSGKEQCPNLLRSKLLYLVNHDWFIAFINVTVVIL